MSDVVLYERRGPSAWITLNRPDKLNAISHELRDALSADAVARAAADDDVRVVVLTGAGRAFSAGYDLSAGGRRQASTARTPGGASCCARTSTSRCSSGGSPKPTIAPVRGWCLAGGMEVAMACDLLVCTAGRPLRRAGDPLRLGPVDAAHAVRARPAR